MIENIQSKLRIYFKSQNLRICIALVLALLIVTNLSRFIFIADTPRIDQIFLSTLPQRSKEWIAARMVRPTPTEVPKPTPMITDSPMNLSVTPHITNEPTVTPNYQPTVTPGPTSSNRLTPTRIPTPTKTRTPTPRKTATPTPRKPTPTKPPTGTSCPTTSSNSYISMNAANPAGLTGDLSTHPEVNLHLRGYGENGETKGLVGRNGNTYGLDDKKPPQISTLYGGTVPTIVKTYDIYEWDFENNRSLAPQRATPNYKVHMIGLNPGKGTPLRGLEAGREIGGGNVFMVLYATQKDILFTHSSANNLEDGYLFYFVDLCVDPNLRAKWEQDSAAGKRQLPVIAPGQIFGTAGSTDVKIAIRDTWSFVDPRYREDWWFYGE